MELPKVINSVPQIISNREIDKALTKGLDTDGLLRLKAVEESVKFAGTGKNITLKDFNTLYETIYKFYKNDKSSDTPGASR